MPCSFFFHLSLLLFLFFAASTRAVKSPITTSSGDPFVEGWKDAYSYSHKWGYYRGYNEAIARRQKDHSNKDYFLTKSQSAPAPRLVPTGSHTSSVRYQKGWNVAFETASQRGYHQGTAAARTGQPYHYQSETKDPLKTISRRAMRQMGLGMASLGSVVTLFRRNHMHYPILLPIQTTTQETQTQIQPDAIIVDRPTKTTSTNSNLPWTKIYLFFLMDLIYWIYCVGALLPMHFGW